MQNFIIDIFVTIVSILLIVIVMLQGSKDDINDAFNGSKSDLFKNQKTLAQESVALLKSYRAGNDAPAGCPLQKALNK